EDGPLKKVAPMYQSQTGITMEIVEFPYDQLFEKLVTTFQANDSSFDLCMMDDPWMPKFGTMGALQPLDSNFGFTRDSDIPTVVYDVGTWPPPHGPVPPSEQGKSPHLYGITIVGNVEMFMYRSDKSAAPASWDEVLSNAAKYNAASFYGYVIRGKATNPVSSDSLPILWSFGGNIFDDTWKVQLDSSDSITAVDFIKWMLKTDNRRTYVAQGGIPIRNSILNDASLASANPYFKALAASFAAVPNWRPRTDQWGAVETSYGTAMNAAVAGQLTPQAAMQKAASEIRTVMKNAGYPS